MIQKIIHEKISQTGQIINPNQEDSKTCPYCGQNTIPFKKGICVCGKQVGSITYIKEPKKFAKNNYSFLDLDSIEKYDIAIEETFVGIEEVCIPGYDYSEEDEKDEHYCSPKCWCKNRSKEESD